MGKSENLRDDSRQTKTRKRHRQWIVPVRVEYDTYATVEAEDLGKAVAKAYAGDFIVSHECDSMVNWQTTGNPEEA